MSRAKKTTKKDEKDIKVVDMKVCSMQLSKKCKDKSGLLPLTEFYTASNTTFYHDGKVGICKNCLKEFVYIDEEVSIDKFKKILGIIDYPFFQTEMKSAIEDKRETVGTYMKNIILNHKGSSSESSDNRIYEDNYFEDDDLKDFEVTPEVQKFWGKSYSKEDLLFLQEYYHSLIRIYDHSLPVQINNYKNMAKTQLQANKCLDTSDMGGYDKAMKILSMLSGDSNIKPVQENASEKITKGGFDVFIKHIEDDEPIFDWEKDLGNRDVIKNLLNIYFFGHLARVLNITNPFQDEYDKEMQSYTVELEEAEEDKNQVDFLGDV